MVNMKSIIIVDCISTGINYIGDIINRGFKPVVLELIPAGEDVEAYRKMLNSHYSQIDENEPSKYKSNMSSLN